MLKYNMVPLEESKNYTERFLFSSEPHGDSSGLKSYSFKLQNTVQYMRRRYCMRVSLKRADPRHIIVTNSNSQDGGGGQNGAPTSWQRVWFVHFVGAKPTWVLLKSSHRLPQSNRHPYYFHPLLSPFHPSQYLHIIS